MLPCHGQDAKDPEQGDNVRVMRREDGSRDVFRRSPDSRTLTKNTTSADGVITMVTIYRMDVNGNPTGCKIYDGQHNELYKSSYGYRKTDGQLVEERMFDSRVKRIDPNTGKEMPVRRFIYTYDAQGRMVSVRGVNKQQRTMEYDDLGRLCTILPSGSSLRFSIQ